MQFKIYFPLAVLLVSTVVECLATNSTESEERKFKVAKLKKIKKKIIPAVVPVPIPIPDISNKPQLPQLPDLPSIDEIFNFEKPSIPTPTLSPQILEIKDTLSGTFTELLNLKNRFPNALAKFGNFSLLQACLLFALGGLLVGFALLIAEAWSFKKDQEDDSGSDLFNLFGHKGAAMMEATQYGAPQYGAPQYGAPSTPSQSYGYGTTGGSQRRRQYKVAPSPTPALPNYYGINVDSNYYSGLQNQRESNADGADPLKYYNYGNGKGVNNPVADSSSQGLSIKDIFSSFLNFPTFNKDKKKKIMFG